MFTSSAGLHRVIYLGLILAQMGCAVHLKGLFENGGDAQHLLYDNDKRLLIRTDSEAVGLMRTDGYLLEIWGKRRFGQLSVSKYKILEGSHGLAHWTGHLAWVHGRLGLVDVEGSQFRPLGGAHLSALNQRIGDLVLVEGYIVGAGEVQVVYYRILAEAEESS